MRFAVNRITRSGARYGQPFTDLVAMHRTGKVFNTNDDANKIIIPLESAATPPSQHNIRQSVNRAGTF